MKRILISLSLSLLLFSCKEEEQPATPKVIYDAGKVASKPVDKDTSHFEVADLPVQMEGTNYLIHAIGDARVMHNRGKASNYTDNVSFSVSNYDRYEFTGYLKNLSFQHQDSTSVRKLTDKDVTIYTATYLKTLADRIKKQVMVYTLADTDSNRDGKLDENDIKSLYLSSVDGTRFTKLSIDMQELIEWTFIDSQDRLYYRCVEDTNKNGEFDQQDMIHYHYCDLGGKEWKVEAYDPVK